MAAAELRNPYLRDMLKRTSMQALELSRDGLLDGRLVGGSSYAETAVRTGLMHLIEFEGGVPGRRAMPDANGLHDTGFFRDLRPFDVLRETIVPAILRRNVARRTLRVWSAGTSAGQEAYSVAMLLRRHFPELVDWDVSIVGTDCSAELIETARRGRYRRFEVNCGLPARLLLEHFVRDGEEWEIRADLRALCRFSGADLCGALPAEDAFDLVLLRNVLLYLPPECRADVLASVHARMVPGGYLMLGIAEQAEDFSDAFEPHLVDDCYFYRPGRAT